MTATSQSVGKGSAVKSQASAATRSDAPFSAITSLATTTTAGRSSTTAFNPSYAPVATMLYAPEPPPRSIRRLRPLISTCRANRRPAPMPILYVAL